VDNATGLTLRRTYASWAQDKGAPGKVVAQLVAHANADITLNVYMLVVDRSLRSAADRRFSSLASAIVASARRMVRSDPALVLRSD
jgi:integrase